MPEYEISLKIMGDRNSYSRTDHDATFMNMKYDYYNQTGVFKPGYNLICLFEKWLSILNFRINEEGKIICPQGNEMDTFINSTIVKRGKYWRPRQYYTSSKCEGCPFSKECMKAKDGRRK